MKRYNPKLIKKILKKKLNESPEDLEDDESNSEETEEQEPSVTVIGIRPPKGGDLTYHTKLDPKKSHNLIGEPPKKEEPDVKKEKGKTDLPTKKQKKIVISKSRKKRIEKYYPIIKKHAEALGFPVNIAMGIAYTESDFRPDVKSSKGALGIMQLMAVTAKDVGVDINRRAETDINVRGALTYIVKKLPKYLQVDMSNPKRNSGSLRWENLTPDQKIRLQLYSYNMGARAAVTGKSKVKFHKGMSPFNNIEDYFDHLEKYYNRKAGYDYSIKTLNFANSFQPPTIQESLIQEDAERLPETPKNKEALISLPEGLTVFLNSQDETSQAVGSFIVQEKVSSNVLYIDRAKGDQASLDLFMLLGGNRTDVGIPYFVFKKGKTYKKFDFDLNGEHKNFTNEKLIAALKEILKEEGVVINDPNFNQNKTDQQEIKESRAKFVVIIKALKTIIGNDGSILFDKNKLKKAGFSSQDEVAVKILELLQKEQGKLNPKNLQIDKDDILAAFTALETMKRRGLLKTSGMPAATLCKKIPDDWKNILDKLFNEPPGVRFGEKTVKEEMSGLEKITTSKKYVEMVIEPAIKIGLTKERVTSSGIKPEECRETIFKKYAALMMQREAKKYEFYSKSKEKDPKTASLLRQQLVFRLRKNGTLVKELKNAAIPVFNKTSNPYEHEMVTFDQTLANFLFWSGYVKVGAVMKTIQSATKTTVEAEGDDLPLDGQAGTQIVHVTKDLLATVTDDDKRAVTELMVDVPDFSKDSRWEANKGWTGKDLTGIYESKYDIERHILWAIFANEYSYNIDKLKNLKSIFKGDPNQTIDTRWPFCQTPAIITTLNGGMPMPTPKARRIKHLRTYGAGDNYASCVADDASCVEATSAPAADSAQEKMLGTLWVSIMTDIFKAYDTSAPDAIQSISDNFNKIADFKSNPEKKKLYYFIIDAVDKSGNYGSNLVERQFTKYYSLIESGEEIDTREFPIIQKINAYYKWTLNHKIQLPNKVVKGKLGI